MVRAQTGKTRRHVEQIMSDTTTTPQQGAGTQTASPKPGQHQQGQTATVTPPQQQAGALIRDWASI